MTGLGGDCVCRSAAPPAAGLYIEVAQDGRVTTLRLYGEINAYTVPTLWARVEAALTHEAWSLVVDLEHVPFLDSEGVGTLLRAQRLVNGTTGGTLLLAAVPAQGRKTIKVKGLDSLLAAFPSGADAAAFLQSWPGVARV